MSKQLQNPIASLISVPIQTNFEFDAGADNDGFASTANLQPLIPSRCDGPARAAILAFGAGLNRLNRLIMCARAGASNRGVTRWRQSCELRGGARADGLRAARAGGM